MNKRKKILCIAAVILCLALLAGNSYANLIKTGTARNVITSSGVRVAVVEQHVVGGMKVDYNGEAVPLMPGYTISRIARARCLEEPSWIRMSYDIEVYDESGKKLNIPAEELARVVLINVDNPEWTLKDGWWYYSDSLNAGQTTTELFESVTFSASEMDDKYQSCTMKILVKAQAVQLKYNGTTVWEAVGWPE